MCGISNSLSVISPPRCLVPPLRVPNPVVTFGRCFLKFPCRRMLTLVNDSDLPGCYGLLPQVWHRILSCRQMLSRVLAKAVLVCIQAGSSSHLEVC